MASRINPSELVLDLGDAGRGQGFVSRASDPVMTPQAYTPVDFANQYPTPLDPTEILTMCEEITLWQALPEMTTGLKEETWREQDELYFTGTRSAGRTQLPFADGECPEEYVHTGESTTVVLKNIGAKKGLTISDIMHSAAVASAGCGINQLVGGIPCGEGLPGGSNVGTFAQEHIADIKAKEIRKGMTLVLNGWDYLLVEGDAATYPLEFNGLRLSLPASCAHTNTSTGTFSAISFDRFLAESCAKPTLIAGHPQAVQEMLAGYFQLGFAGSQVVNFSDGGRITPGFNFAGFVNTGVGQMAVIADCNFIRQDQTGTFQSALYALRMTHNGEPLIYKRTQIPLALQDLVPGCTAISFEIWAKTALIVKACCTHGVYSAKFTGRIVTTCPIIGD